MAEYLKKVSIICSCYKGEKYLESFLNNVEQQTILLQIELIIDLNEPTKKELELISDFSKKHPGLIIHQVIQPVTTTPASFNRCIRAANGQYLTTWSVDDHRTPESLALMSQTLYDNPRVGFTWGDFIVVNELGKKEGLLIQTSEFDPIEFTHSMCVGPFLMWRSCLTSKIGYWDEQLFCGSDFDFAIRLALLSEGKKTHGNHGYYLNIGQGTSTGGKHAPKDIQPIERTVIELRYGRYYRTTQLQGYPYVQKARKYQLDQLLIIGVWHPIENYIPHYRQLLKEQEQTRGDFEKAYRKWKFTHYLYWLPFAVMKAGRTIIRWILEKLRMRESAHNLYDKFCTQFELKKKTP